MSFLRRLAGEHEVTATVLNGSKDGGFNLEVVGESHYQDALWRAVGSIPDDQEDVHTNLQAALVPEPDNEHDSNAIAVHIEGRRVGYLSRGDARRYRTAFQKLADEGRVGACDAWIRGGFWVEGRRLVFLTKRSRANLGVWLDLATPRSVLPEELS
jgi:hypothetical protein